MGKVDIEKLKEEIDSSEGNGEKVIKKLKELLMTDMSFLAISFFNKTIKKLTQEDLSRFTHLKVSIICNATIEPFDQYLKAEAFKYDLLMDIYLVDHYRYTEEIMDKGSSLYANGTNLVILHLIGEELRPDLYHRFGELSIDDRKEIEMQTTSIINGLIDKIKSFSKCPLIVSNMIIPSLLSDTVTGHYNDNGYRFIFNRLNESIYKNTSAERGIYYFDLDGVVNMVGKDNYRDIKRWYLAKQPFSNSFMPILSREYMRYILPITGKNKKCLILDLDNMLWGGIAGEDGLENIDIGETPKGRAYLQLQREILNLHNKGIILAINSKNNLEDALMIIDKHPDMILKRKHFAAMKINWNDKAENIKLIAGELNIGTNSMVFIDDMPEERELVRMELPEVIVPDMPDEPASYVSVLKSLPVFDSLFITEEDKERGRLYAEDSQRIQIKKSYMDIKDYYIALEIKVDIGRADKFTIPRISQLTMKTNQFNLSTRRYSPEEIAELSSSEKNIVLWLRSEDKFGSNGIVAVAIIKKESLFWFIDTFLMSCRVIGRTIEKAFLSYIISMARAENINEIKAEYIPTVKNQPAKDFLKENGFLKSDENSTRIIWAQKINGLNVECPSWITIAVV